MARAPGFAGLPAPGHPPARLRAEAAQAGIQARGLRALRPVARLGEERGHAPAHDGARADRRAVRGSGGGAGKPRREPVQHHLHRADRDRRGRSAGRRRKPAPPGHLGPERWCRRLCARRPQRPLPLRQRQEVQALPRQTQLMHSRTSPCQ
ncbi:hypothetical protein LJR290_004386 [Variovorax sp. LjRoot290]